MVGVEQRVRSLGRGLGRVIPLLLLPITSACLDMSGSERTVGVVHVDATPSGAGKVPIVPVDPPTSERLRAQFPRVELTVPPCQEAFLSDEPDRDAVFFDVLAPAVVLHVDAAAVGVPDGSAERPFPTIEEALAQAGSGTQILVAPGQYRQELTIPAGVRLTGDPAPNAEQAAARPVLVANGVTFAPSDGPGQISVLEQLEVHASVTLLPGARVVLEDNVLSPPLSQAPNGIDIAAVVAVSGVDVALRARRNVLFVDSPEPQRVYSQGFNLRGSCAVLEDNYLADYRVPFELSSASDAAIQFNVIDQGANGFFVGDSAAVINANYARLRQPTGCVYAVYSAGASRPLVSNNQFYLQDPGTKGFDEASVDSDPSVFVGNAFRVRWSGTPLYLNRETNDKVLAISDIAELNALGDITEVGGNSLSVELH
jgi:hypothetical protein